PAGAPPPARAGPAGRRRRRGARGRGGVPPAIHRGGHTVGRGAGRHAPRPLDRLRAAARGDHRPRRARGRPSLPHQPHRPPRAAAGRRAAPAERDGLRLRRVRGGGRGHAPDPHRAGAPVDPRAPQAGARRRAAGSGSGLVEALLALLIGVLAGAGVWLVLRPRTFQVILGLALLSYAVNLFIFSMGSLYVDKPPILAAGLPPDLEHYTDPLPQALVLTAIVIGFATTA